MIHWASWSEFWAMGGHALFVWGSYAVTLVLVAGELWLLGQRRRAALAAARQPRAAFDDERADDPAGGLAR
jgi:heme exporter protein D